MAHDPRPPRIPYLPAMRPSSFLLAAAVTLAGSRPGALGAQTARPVSAAVAAARVEAALRAQPVVDGHNDLPWAIREATRDAGRADLPDVEAYDLRRRTSGQTDLARLRQGRVGVQFWSVYIPGEPDAEVYERQGTVTGTPGYARVQLEAIDVARRTIARYPDALALVTRHAEVAPRCAPAGSPASSAWRAGTPSRTRSARCAPTTTSACVT
jgi:membrane dipeptidase